VLTAVSYLLNLSSVDQQQWAVAALGGRGSYGVTCRCSARRGFVCALLQPGRVLCVVTEKNTVSGNTCQGPSDVFRMERIPLTVSFRLLSVAAVTRAHAEWHHCLQAGRWCQGDAVRWHCAAFGGEALIVCH